MKRIIRDFLWVLAMLLLCLLIGMALNRSRSTPLSLNYKAPQARLDDAVSQIGPSTPPKMLASSDAELEELKQTVLLHSAIILDARPAVFYKVSHIPTALSLPRDEFESRYPALKDLLNSHKGEQIIVYCVGKNCNDSRMVADALRKLNYQTVKVFRGGWSEWKAAHLPEEHG